MLLKVYLERYFTMWDQTTIDKIRKGYYSAVYFNRTKEILLKENNVHTVTMQLFQKNDETALCGINHVIELLKVGTGFFDNNTWISKYDLLKIEALSDGDIISAKEPIMHITGPYAFFAHLESLYLGILARETRIATNARNIVHAANKKNVLFFADRFDYFLNQEIDGYAAHIGGMTNICTDAQGNWINEKPVGTIPHALIAVNNGNTRLATKLFAKHYPDSPLVALVDFDNDIIATALSCAKEFGGKLWGIRIDTSETLIDRSLKEISETTNELHGVNTTLIKKVRNALDKEGYKHVKIIVSGGFTPGKIAMFEKENAPVDIYAVGSAMLLGKYDFTADIVKVENETIAKIGRKFIANNRLHSI